jgi:hypothetical protein
MEATIARDLNLAWTVPEKLFTPFLLEIAFSAGRQSTPRGAMGLNMASTSILRSPQVVLRPHHPVLKYYTILTVTTTTTITSIRKFSGHVLFREKCSLHSGGEITLKTRVSLIPTFDLD